MNRTSSTRKNLVSVAIVVAALVGVAPASAQKSNFSIGTAVGTQLSTCPSDPGGVNGACWGLNVSGCPNPVTLPYDATVKVTSPSGASIGTIIFLAGAGGEDFYDRAFKYGSSMIEDVLGAGYTVVQIRYNNPVAGWLTGPALDGPLSLACLPSTSMQWVYDNVLSSGTPLCVTGNSGGGQAIAYAVSQYGLGAIFSMVEPTSGPGFSRLDHGCAPEGDFTACAICGFSTQIESYGAGAAAEAVDPAYTGSTTVKGPCSYDLQGSTRYASQLRHDSTLSDEYPPTLSFPGTDIHIVFGGQDANSPSISQGIDWASAISSPTAIVCVPSAGHELPSSQAGAAQIENDLIRYCKPRPELSLPNAR